jgi:5-methyltetrahydropteroyltriglutamate--homocysteine methyltransferase
VDYLGLLPALFRLQAGRFYVQLARERILGAYWRPSTSFLRQTRFHLLEWRTQSILSSTAEEVRDRVLEAVRIIPVDSLGTTNDCGFSPLADDTSTSRNTAFAKIRSRVEGTRLASQILGV